MQFQSVLTATTAEKAFRVARNSYTATATITAASFVRGNPVILATASENGYDVIHGETAAELVNNLYIGNVHDYPDTTNGQTGVWQPEDHGLIQCYGVDADAVVQNATDSIAAGEVLVPDTGSRLTTTVIRMAAASTGTTANALVTGAAGLVVLLDSVATSSAAGTVAATVHIRAM